MENANTAYLLPTMATKWFQDNKVNILEAPSQRAELNPTGWKVLCEQGGLKTVCQEEWAKGPANYCQKLVEAYLKHFTQIVQFKNNATKYD